MRIEHVTVGAGSFTPPTEAFVDRGVSPREGNSLLFFMLGLTKEQISRQYGISVDGVSSQIDRAYDKLRISGHFAASRAALGLGVIATDRETPISVKTEMMRIVDDLSKGLSLAEVAQELSQREAKPVSENTAKQRLNRIRELNPGQHTRLIITRAFLSGQLPLPGLKLPD